jgi:hypothetical protein
MARWYLTLEGTIPYTVNFASQNNTSHLYALSSLISYQNAANVVGGIEQKIVN